MSRIQILKTLVNERLNAAAEEIFGFFEKTITQYEEEVDRQRKLLNLALNSQIQMCITDPLELISREEEFPTEQKKWSPDPGQADPKPSQIKEEQNDLWTTQGGEQLQGLEEADITRVKSENDDGRTLCSQNSQMPMEENREGNPLPCTSTGQMETNPDGEDSNGVLARNLDPPHDLESSGDGQHPSPHYSKTETEYGGDDWRETREPESGSNSLKSKKTQRVKGHILSISKTFNRSGDHELKSSCQTQPFPSCKVCGSYFPTKLSLTRHVKVHSRDCGLCGKHLEPTESLKIHYLVHRTCDFCGRIFGSINNCIQHVRTHTGEKPFSCTVCGKRFCLKGNLKKHMTSHTGEKPFSCAVCSKSFGLKAKLMRHMTIHTGEKPFSCTVCGRGFSLTDQLKTHMRIHTGEKPWSCSSCGNRFTQISQLKKHKCRIAVAESSSS